MECKVKNLVICSTLNQITNYLIINRLKPENVYNITFNKKARDEMAYNIKIEEWDKVLKEVCSPLGITIKDIELSSNQAKNIEKIKRVIRIDIIDRTKEEIYWHITGGQRIVALAINNVISEDKRKDDTIMYVDGNTDKLIAYSGAGIPKPEIDYAKKDLDFRTALNLSGFKTQIHKSTHYFKVEGKQYKNFDNNEHEFYLELYKEIKKKGYGDEFRKGLLHSNSVKNSGEEKSTFENPSRRSKCVKNLFDKLDEKTNIIKDNKYEIAKAKELYMYYPAGYIFEKIVAHKIYSIVKNNSKIAGMVGSLKTYFNTDIIENNDGKIKDEIDIALLTDTGKIINFECKSGGMEGDNAKSTKYTTYRLSGVFGMPILMSPLYKDEFPDENIKARISQEQLKRQLQAVRAAKAAELEVIAIDEIDEKKLKDLRILINNENEEE